MPHYVPNEYPNIFECNIFTKRISKYIRTLEIARIRIQIIFGGHFTGIFKYSYSSLIKEIFEKGSLMLSLNKLDGVGPVDNKPSTDKLHHFLKKKKITCDT